MWWRGLDAVDYVLATHADADHIDGLNDVLRNFTVDSAIVARTPANDPEYAKFAQTWSTTSTPVATVQAGDLIRFGDVQIAVLWPPAATDANDASRNNDSIVLRITFGRRSLLLTGDIEKSGENALAAAGRTIESRRRESAASRQPHFFNAAAFVAAAKPRLCDHFRGTILDVWTSASGRRRALASEWRAGLDYRQVRNDHRDHRWNDLTVTGMQSRTSRESPCRAGPVIKLANARAAVSFFVLLITARP